MGLTSGRIAKQFFVMLLMVLGVAFVLGNVFSLFITSHFASLALQLFDYTLNTGFNVLSQAIFAALTVLTAFLSVLLLYRKINKVSISQTLAQRE
jgi:ABC-type antimicrobial peptide transport system permease subunit